MKPTVTQRSRAIETEYTPVKLGHVTLESVFQSMRGSELGWSHAATPPFPERWPLTPDTHVHAYGYAYRTSPASPQVLLTAGPYAVATSGLDLRAPSITILATRFEELGPQGMFPLSAGFLARLRALPATHFATALTRALEPAELAALGTRYAFFRKCHGVICNAVKGRHVAFFQWLDTLPPLAT
jgi:hypothetical protein